MNVDELQLHEFIFLAMARSCSNSSIAPVMGAAVASNNQICHMLQCVGRDDEGHGFSMTARVQLAVFSTMRDTTVTMATGAGMLCPPNSTRVHRVAQAAVCTPLL